MTYRALVILLIALLMALSAYVGFAVGITFAASRSDQFERTPLGVSGPPLAHTGRTGAPQNAIDIRPESARASDAPSPAAVVARTAQPSASAVSVRETSGWAAWCAPTPTRCQGWGGDALLAGVPSFRWGDEPYTVQVSANGRSVLVTVVSFCACGDRKGIPTVIDLSPAAFAELAPLTVGVLSVTVRVP
jgi:hypothetical protein